MDGDGVGSGRRGGLLRGVHLEQPQGALLLAAGGLLALRSQEAQQLQAPPPDPQPVEKVRLGGGLEVLELDPLLAGAGRPRRARLHQQLLLVLLGQLHRAAVPVEALLGPPHHGLELLEPPGRQLELLRGRDRGRGDLGHALLVGLARELAVQVEDLAPELLVLAAEPREELLVAAGLRALRGRGGKPLSPPADLMLAGAAAAASGPAADRQRVLLLGQGLEGVTPAEEGAQRGHRGGATAEELLHAEDRAVLGVGLPLVVLVLVGGAQAVVVLAEVAAADAVLEGVVDGRVARRGLGKSGHSSG